MTVNQIWNAVSLLSVEGWIITPKINQVGLFAKNKSETGMHEVAIIKTMTESHNNDFPFLNMESKFFMPVRRTRIWRTPAQIAVNKKIYTVYCKTELNDEIKKGIMKKKRTTNSCIKVLALAKSPLLRIWKISSGFELFKFFPPFQIIFYNLSGISTNIQRIIISPKYNNIMNSIKFKISFI